METNEMGYNGITFSYNQPLKFKKMILLKLGLGSIMYLTDVIYLSAPNLVLS